MKPLKLAATGIFVSILFLAGLFVASHHDLIDFYKPYVVLSGSMEPALPTGSVVLIRPKLFGYAQGDIITFKQGKQNVVTHRVHQFQQVDNDIAYITKGDANEEADQGVVEKGQVLGAVNYSIPYLGYLVKFSQTPQGFILFVIIPATIIVYEELKNIRQEIAKNLAKLRRSNSPKHSNKSNSKSNSNATKYAAAVPIIAMIFIITSVSAAYFSDREKSQSNVLLAAETWDPPTPEPTPVGQVEHVVINEVLYDLGTNQGVESNFEWIELYNPALSSAVLDGWSISDNSDTASISALTIPGNGFAILSRSTQTELESTGWSFPAGTQFYQINLIQLSNDGDELILRDLSKSVIDAISYGDNTNQLNPSIPDVDPGHSIERFPVGTDIDTNTEWIDQASPSPGN